MIKKQVMSPIISSASAKILVLALSFVSIVACGQNPSTNQQARKDAKEIAKYRAEQNKSEQNLATPNDADSAQSVAQQASTETKPSKAIAKELKSVDAAKAAGTLAFTDSSLKASQNKKPVSGKKLNLPEVKEDVTLDRVKNETTEALAVADAFLKQQEKKYHSKIDSELQQFSEKVQQLQLRAKNAAGVAKKRVSTQLTELRNQMTVTGSQLGDFNQRSESELGALSDELKKLLAILETGTDVSTDESAKVVDPSSKKIEQSSSS